MPVPARRLPTGTIIVDQAPAPAEMGAALYARVSSLDQRANLDRQIARLTEYASGQGVPVVASVAEVGSGLNSRRPRLMRLLADSAAKAGPSAGPGDGV